MRDTKVGHRMLRVSTLEGDVASTARSCSRDCQESCVEGTENSDKHMLLIGEAVSGLARCFLDLRYASWFS